MLCVDVFLWFAACGSLFVDRSCVMSVVVVCVLFVV